jgi:hypothetical protein
MLPLHFAMIRFGPNLWERVPNDLLRLWINSIPKVCGENLGERLP